MNILVVFIAYVSTGSKHIGIAEVNWSKGSEKFYQLFNNLVWGIFEWGVQQITWPNRWYMYKCLQIILNGSHYKIYRNFVRTVSTRCFTLLTRWYLKQQARKNFPEISLLRYFDISGSYYGTVGKKQVGEFVFVNIFIAWQEVYRVIFISQEELLVLSAVGLYSSFCVNFLCFHF